MNNRATFTTSWDDGHPHDLRLAELLSKRDFPATFYVPLSNREGLPVMSAGQIRELGTSFEIGSHTLDHCYLTSLHAAEARRQIVDGKHRLEDILGRPVRGFCYPGGEFDRSHRQLAIDAGFAYARTNVNFVNRPAQDRYRIPTTIQFYPHSRTILLRNYLRKGDWLARNRIFRVAMQSADIASRVRAMVDHVCATGGVFHLWGHTFELDGFDGWKKLDSLLHHVAERIPRAGRLTNECAFSHAAHGSG